MKRIVGKTIQRRVAGEAVSKVARGRTEKLRRVGTGHIARETLRGMRPSGRRKVPDISNGKRTGAS